MTGATQTRSRTTWLITCLTALMLIVGISTAVTAGAVTAGAETTGAADGDGVAVDVEITPTADPTATADPTGEPTDPATDSADGADGEDSAAAGAAEGADGQTPGDDSTAPGGSLPDTGTDVTLVVSLAALLLITGAGVVLRARRGRSASSTTSAGDRPSCEPTLVMESVVP
ncbi:LPXTG cell wall anchor domain-containing protein [Pseudactinotalea sp. HY158]|uniref:LPXTG cell wall anchor domain-containing protein n=1 Tax=Pseudactinotalea sp. HY158 TaxID=2654547 RepID=UPI00129C4EBB|nr:LPXTG cell wall anchor domain-containing protein [Pseudactinotalea sp. HY158]QGH70027.1 LPXTG cell wall anchor domain-containing protein [Pseudactinotalea sp. HY158]